MSSKKITSREKAAMLLISLGKEYTSEVFKYLNNDEIKQLTIDITNMKRVEPDEREMVISEFHTLVLAQRYISEGGLEYAKDVLSKALGNQKAVDLIRSITASIQTKPFDFLQKIDPTQLFHFIKNEHPQTIALIISYLHPTVSASILNSLPQERQADVVARITKMGRVSPEYIKEVEKVFERKVSTVNTSDFTLTGGIDLTVSILNEVDRATERNILESLEMQDEELAEDIRRRMFVFEDIVKLNKLSIQRVLRDVDNSDLTVALKGAAKDVLDVILQNLSKRMQDVIKEEMDLIGPVRIRDVENAQQKIVNAVRNLEESGEIVIVRGLEDAYIG